MSLLSCEGSNASTGYRQLLRCQDQMKTAEQQESLEGFCSPLKGERQADLGGAATFKYGLWWPQPPVHALVESLALECGLHLATWLLLNKIRQN